MINATVTSRLDYCNSLLYGAKQSNIDRQQYCQNNAARIISKIHKFDHISHVFKELHWLPVEHRISYKILLLTYKALNGHAPQYFAALISKYVPPRPLRSDDQYLLNSPRWRLETFGKRAFSYAAPILWNPLTLSVKQAPSIDSFKTRLPVQQSILIVWLISKQMLVCSALRPHGITFNRYIVNQNRVEITVDRMATILILGGTS